MVVIDSPLLRWEDPPRANVSWKDVVEELKEHPGRWARVFGPVPGRRANDVYTQIRKHGAEAVVRKVDGEGSGVWARWPA